MLRFGVSKVVSVVECGRRRSQEEAGRSVQGWRETTGQRAGGCGVDRPGSVSEYGRDGLEHPEVPPRVLPWATKRISGLFTETQMQDKEQVRQGGER